MNTGLVVLAEVGDGDRVEYTAMGDAVNLASRMEAAAEPGTILLTEATRKLLKWRFDTTSIGALHIRGKTDPVVVHRLLGVSTEEHRPARPHRTRFVGRSRELARIEQVLESGRRGKGALVVMTGEAGVGKSRMVNELRKSTCRSWHWAEARIHETQQAAGFGAARSILHGLTQYENLPEGTTVGGMLREQIDRLDPSVTPHLFPYLSLVLDCADPEVADNRLRHLEPEILRARIVQALRQICPPRCRLGADRPLVGMISTLPMHHRWACSSCSFHWSVRYR